MITDIAGALEYYLERKPTRDEVAEAQEWAADNPTTNLDEYVSAMIEIGAL